MCHCFNKNENSGIYVAKDSLRLLFSWFQRVDYIGLRLHQRCRREGLAHAGIAPFIGDVVLPFPIEILWLGPRILQQSSTGVKWMPVELVGYLSLKRQLISPERPAIIRIFVILLFCLPHNKQPGTEQLPRALRQGRSKNRIQLR